ncbi:MAG: DHA2 family efflux MFS transporter permease subunit [SAR324 cluster bacterium]|nr:DHA2 family efflux MFS transporter permease subunit [SAR324 cluster bacterium]
MPEAPEAASVNRWILLVVLMIGTFMSVLDSTIMNVAMPHIMSSFGSNLEKAQWISTGFMIAAAVAMPLTSWLGRRVGYGTLFVGALTVFTVGAAFSTLAWSLNGLIFSRIVQGIGGGIVQPTSIAILARVFPPDMRGRAFGIWSIGVMVAPTLGPTVGGVLIEFFGWRAIFTMSLGVGIMALLLASAVLSRERDEEPQPFDFPGYLALSVFLVSALLTVANGQEQGWTSNIILLGGALAATSLTLFFVVEWDAEYPIVPLRMFRVPDLSLSLVLNLFKATTWGGGSFLLPVFLHQVQRRASMQIGLLMMPGAMMMALGSPVAGYLTDRIGGRWLAFAGTLCMAYGVFLYHSLDTVSELWMILYPQFIRGVGMALISTPVMTTAVNAVPREDAGNASWMLKLSQRIGGAFSISILSTILSRQTSIQKDNLGRSALANVEPSQDMIYLGMSLGFSSLDARSAARAVFGRTLGKAATTLAFQNLFLMLGTVALLASIPAFFLTVFKTPPAASPAGD